MSQIIVKRMAITQVSAAMAYSATAFVGTTYDTPRTPYSSTVWRRTLINALRDTSMLPLAAWRGDVCVGILLGQILSMPWTNALCATDVVYVAEQGGDLLLSRFVEWCDANKVARIDMGVSDHGDRAGFDRLFSGAGFSKAGGMYYRVKEAAR